MSRFSIIFYFGFISNQKKIKENKIEKNNIYIYKFYINNNNNHANLLFIYCCLSVWLSGYIFIFARFI